MNPWVALQLGLAGFNVAQALAWWSEGASGRAVGSSVVALICLGAAWLVSRPRRVE